MRFKIFSLLMVSSLLTGCMSEGQLKDKMAKVLAENPEVLTFSNKKALT